MSSDTQHLEFLISQYVDQTLDAGNRKLIEQQIASDPVAAGLYKEHCEVQDVLEDWGNRLPMIHWEQFDRTLATRLEQADAAEASEVTPLRRWGRILAAAAALFVAGTVGYTWHAFSTAVPPSATTIAQRVVDHAGPQHTATVFAPAATGPSMDAVTYEHPQTARGSNKIEVLQYPVDKNSPPLGTALVEPREAHNPGLQNLPANTGSVVGAVKSTPRFDRSDVSPGSF